MECHLEVLLGRDALGPPDHIREGPRGRFVSGGKRSPKREESVVDRAERGVVVEAPPRLPLEVIEA